MYEGGGGALSKNGYFLEQTMYNHTVYISSTQRASPTNSTIIYFQVTPSNYGSIFNTNSVSYFLIEDRMGRKVG